MIDHDEMTDWNFGRWVRKQRTRKSLTRTTLVKNTGLTFERILEIEYGRKRGASRQECIAIARGLRVNPCEALSVAAGEV